MMIMGKLLVKLSDHFCRGRDIIGQLMATYQKLGQTVE